MFPAKSSAATPPEPNSAYTVCPSVTGVGVAYEFFPSFRVVCWSKTFLSHRTFPSAALRHSTRHDTPRSPVPVKKIRSPHTTGDDHPSAGTGVFHATFSVADHLVGRFVSVEIPCPFGPRNRGQFSACECNATSAVTRIAVSKRLIFTPNFRHSIGTNVILTAAVLGGAKDLKLSHAEILHCAEYRSAQ